MRAGRQANRKRKPTISIGNYTQDAEDKLKVILRILRIFGSILRQPYISIVALPERELISQVGYTTEHGYTVTELHTDDREYHTRATNVTPDGVVQHVSAIANKFGTTLANCEFRIGDP